MDTTSTVTTSLFLEHAKEINHPPPPIWWNFNSSVYFDAFDKEANGANYYPVSGPPLKIFMMGFVHDNNCNCNEDAIDHKTKPDDLVSCSGDNTKLWHNLLWTT
jgi:hypothetical protein